MAGTLINDLSFFHSDITTKVKSQFNDSRDIFLLIIFNCLIIIFCIASIFELYIPYNTIIMPIFFIIISVIIFPLFCSTIFVLGMIMEILKIPEKKLFLFFNRKNKYKYIIQADEYDIVNKSIDAFDKHIKLLNDEFENTEYSYYTENNIRFMEMGEYQIIIYFKNPNDMIRFRLLI